MTQSASAPMLLVYEFLRSALVTRVSMMPDEVRTRVLKGVQDAVNAVRPYTIANVEDLRQIWDIIRKEPAVTDFVIELTTQLEVMLHDCPLNYEQCLGVLAAALSAHRVYDRLRAHCAIDEDLFERMPAGQAFEVMLKANRWYGLLLLLQHRPDLLIYPHSPKDPV